MPIDDEFGSSHDVENRRRRRRVDFDDDCCSAELDSFSHEEQSHLHERHWKSNYEGHNDEPPIRRYYRERAFGTGASDADKGTDKPQEEQPRYRRASYQC